MRMMSGLVSCTGAPFERRESAVFTVPQFMGRENVRMQFVCWYTLTFKDERHMCALALYEHIEGQDCKHLWTTYTTTCDPFGQDNFTAPLGLRPLEHTRALRGTKRDDGFFILAENVLTYLTPACKTIEQRVFLERKGIGHLIALETARARMGELALERELKRRMRASRGLGATGLREILTHVHADRVPRAEMLFVTPEMTEMTPDQKKEVEKAEKSALQAIADALPDGVFLSLYMAWVRYVCCEMTRTHRPAEYKKRGRWFLMDLEEEVPRWNECVFLLLLTARAECAAKESPHDFKFGTLYSGSRTFAELSNEDKRFASCNGLKLQANVEAAEAGTSTWLFEETERLVRQQGDFLGKLKAFCDAGDVAGALHHLTKGTAAPYEGQGLLGLAIALLRDLTLGRIVFPPALLEAIGAHLNPFYFHCKSLIITITTTTATTTTTSAAATDGSGGGAPEDMMHNEDDDDGEGSSSSWALPLLHINHSIKETMVAVLETNPTGAGAGATATTTTATDEHTMIMVAREKRAAYERLRLIGKLTTPAPPATTTTTTPAAAGAMVIV